MPYRNIPRLVLGALTIACLISAIGAGVVFVGPNPDDPGQVVEHSPLALAACVLLIVAFIVTGTAWLVLRGVNYDTWYRATHVGEPLHLESPTPDGVPANWKAAERDPNA